MWIDSLVDNAWTHELLTEYCLSVCVVIMADDARGTPILYQVISDDYDDGDCRVVIAGWEH